MLNKNNSLLFFPWIKIDISSRINRQSNKMATKILMNEQLFSELLQKAWEFQERQEYLRILEEQGRTYIADLVQALKEEADQEWLEELNNRF